MVRRFAAKFLPDLALAWRRLKRRVVRVFTQNAEPRMIALGAAIGVFAAIVPFPFLQVIIALALATFLRANRLAAVTLVWLANPAFFYVDYVVGRALLASLRLAAWEAQVLSWEGFLKQLQESVFVLVGAVFVPTLVGSLVFGLACSAATYAIALRVVTYYRSRFAGPRPS